MLNRIVIGNKMAVGIGLISYPLYLWHWPLLVFARIYKSTPNTDLERIWVIAIAFALAWLTYSFVEKPIRLKRRSVAGILLASMASIAGIVVFPALGVMFLAAT